MCFMFAKPSKRCRLKQHVPVSWEGSISLEGADTCFTTNSSQVVDGNPPQETHKTLSVQPACLFFLDAILEKTL